MARPLGKLKSFTAAFFSSSESEAAFMLPATPMMAIPRRVTTTPRMTLKVSDERASSLREEDVEQHRTHDGTETCAGSQGDALTQCHAQVAHGETEGQSAYAPEYTEEHGHRHIEADIRRIIQRKNVR